MSNVYKARERRLRRLARRKDYWIWKSRKRKEDMNDQGLYMVLEDFTNRPIIGWNFDADLDAVEEFLTTAKKVWG